MSDETLDELIQQLNSKKTKELIFIRPLGATVDLAKVWSKKPKPLVQKFFSDRENIIYFIKNEAGVYVGAVYDMKNNLHWYILSAYRKQGHLTRALKEFIFPFMFQSTEEIKISITCGVLSAASESVALNAGFKKVVGPDGGSRYVLKSEDFKTVDFAFSEKKLLSEKRFIELKSQIEAIYRQMKIIKSELELYKGFSAATSQEIDQLTQSLKDFTHTGLYEVWKSSHYKDKQPEL